MTGRTPSRTCIYGVEQHILCHPTPNKVGGCTGAEFGIGNATQNKGYNTGFFGKWHMGGSLSATRFPTATDSGRAHR